MVTKPITVGLKYMTPEQKRAYQAQKQREYHARRKARLLDRGEYRESLKDKAAARLAAGKRALELKQQAPELTLRTIAKRMGLAESYVGYAVREVERLGL